jgi:hypothetical protein
MPVCVLKTSRSKTDYARMDARDYLILDASVVASYYVPESGDRFKYLSDRIRVLMEAVKTSRSGNRRLLIPSVCIPEVFSIFSKYRFGSWNPQVKRTINDISYWRARLQFHNDIHNGRHIQQLDLSRYHILATDLISPVDHYYEYYRQHARKLNKRPMGASDHMIIAMGIDLVKTRGRECVLIVTADRRMGHIIERAKSIKRKSAAKLGLLKTAQDLGLRYGPDIYPRVLNLATARTSELIAAFGEWPLSTPELPKVARTKLAPPQKEELIRLYRRVTDETSESFMYTDEFEILYEAFVARTGLNITRNEVSRTLSNIRKRGHLPKRRRNK